MSDENSRRKLLVFFTIIFNAFIILLLSSVTMPIATNKRKLKDSRVWPIYFLKTHKTGGSTLQNIIYRYAFKNNLRLAFPKHGYTFCGSTEEPWHESCTNEKSGEYQMIANHHVWSPVIDQVLPSAKKITILREPISQTISVFCYVIDQAVKEEIRNLTTFNHFIRRNFNDISTNFSLQKSPNFTPEFEKKMAAIYAKMMPPPKFRAITHNPNAVDMGVKNYRSKFITPENFSKRMISYFDLILITEHFDESLILLKDLLSLEFSDIVYIKAKENHDKQFGEADLSSETKDLILQRQFVDRVLYDAANATLWRKIDDFGRSKMESELKILRRMKEQADPSEELLSLQGGKFMDFMKEKQYPDSV